MQEGDLFKSPFLSCDGNVQSLCQPDCECNRFGAGTTALLLMAAIEQRTNRSAALDQQQANPLWTTKLMPADRQSGCAQFVEAEDRQLANRLSGVSVKERVRSTSHRIANRLNVARFVIDQHQRNHARLRANPLCD